MVNRRSHSYHRVTNVDLRFILRRDRKSHRSMEDKKRLSDASQAFIYARQADQYSPYTINIFKGHIKQMIDYLEDPEIENITTQDLQRFLSWLQTDYVPKRSNGLTTPLAPATISNAWCTIRSLFRWAADEMHIPRPDLSIKQPQYEHPEIVPFTQDQIKKLLSVCTYTKVADTNNRKSFMMPRPTALRDQTIIFLLLDTGLRASDCARLTVKDIDLEGGSIFIAPFGGGKKTKSRTVYFGRDTRRTLWKYLTNLKPDLRDPLFLTKDNRPIDRISLAHVLRRLGERAGISNVHPHRLPHICHRVFT